MFFKLLVAVLLIVIVIATHDFYTLYRQIQLGKVLAQQAVPFERLYENATMRILVAGDSTAYGTGATKPEFSTAGRFGTEYPDAEIVNISENGLKLDGLVKKLKERSENDSLGTFDLVVLQIGANDILRYTNLSDVKNSLTELIDMISPIAEQVTVLHSATVGDALLFPRYVGYFYNKRSHSFRDLYLKTTETYDNVTYVDLIGRDQETVLFQNNPEQFYASDKLHLGDEGYRVWFEEELRAISQ